MFIHPEIHMRLIADAEDAAIDRALESRLARLLREPGEQRAVSGWRRIVPAAARRPAAAPCAASSRRA